MGNLLTHKVSNLLMQCVLSQELVALHNKYSGNGLEILAFPCNQFGSQEPGSNDQICDFAAGKGAQFKMMDKARASAMSSCRS